MINQLLILQEKLIMWLVWRFPPSLVKWVLIRAFARVSHVYPDQEVLTLTVAQAMEVWDNEG